MIVVLKSIMFDYESKFRAGQDFAQWNKLTLFKGTLDEVDPALTHFQPDRFWFLYLDFLVHNFETKTASEILLHKKHFTTLITIVIEAIPLVEEVGLFQVRDLILVVFWLLSDILNLLAFLLLDDFFNHLFNSGIAKLRCFLSKVNCLAGAVQI